MSIFSIALPFPFYLYFPPALLSFSVWILWCKEWHDRTKRPDFIPSWSPIQARIDLKLLVFSPLNELVTLFWKGIYILVFWGFHLVCEEAFEVLFQISSTMFCVHYSGASISYFSFRDCNSSSWQWGSVLCHHPMVSLFFHTCPWWFDFFCYLRLMIPNFKIPLYCYWNVFSFISFMFLFSGWWGWRGDLGLGTRKEIPNGEKAQWTILKMMSWQGWLAMLGMCSGMMNSKTCGAHYH